MADRIDPETLIRERGVSALCETADIPYEQVLAADPTHLMALPFGNPMVTAEVLYNLSFLLAGLHLGKTMRVLDFGAGACWLSRCLNQMGCATISLDPSPAALEIGRRLFKEHPPIGGCEVEPVFLPFDGHAIQLDDESVDRVICHDSFHHVPNQREILDEFHRILKPGGIAGFSEPGRFHSRAEQSQRDMRIHGVLENDMILEDIWAHAQEAGFTRIVVKPAFSPLDNLSHEDYQAIAHGRSPLALRHPRRIWSVLKAGMNLLRQVTNRTDFMLHKGPLIRDSRLSFAALGGVTEAAGAHDLQYEMRAGQVQYTARAGEPIYVSLRVKNTGSIRWLHTNIVDFAVVKVGAHLCDGDMRILDHDFLRAYFEGDVSPGQEAALSFSFRIDHPGQYNVVLDLVSERVTWFEYAGSKPVRLAVSVPAEDKDAR